jgi:biotin operon repressor
VFFLLYNNNKKVSAIMNNESTNESNSKRKEVILYESSSFGSCQFIKQLTTNCMKGNHKMKTINEMTKAELVIEAQRLQEVCDANTAIVMNLTQQLEASSKDGRKSQVLELLRENKTISILEISSKLGISTKNVSSQLTYLRSDGYAIFTDPNGRKCLFETSKVEDGSVTVSDPIIEDDSITDEDLESLVDSADSDEPTD